MATEVWDSLVIDIENKLNDQSSKNFDHCIYRVPNELCKVKAEAYESQVISIGPYHRGKDHIKAMDEHKICFLGMFRERSTKTVAELVESFKKLEEDAWKCYERPVDIPRDKFVEMMIFDGCFIVEFLCKHFDGERGDLGSVFRKDQIMLRLVLDLLLVENQLPFFVLMKLFSMTGYKNKERVIRRILRFFKSYSVLPGKGYVHEVEYTEAKIVQIKHLLALIHENCQPPPSLMIKSDAKNRETCSIIPCSICFIEFWKKDNSKDKNEKHVEKTYIPRCAMELKEAGIKFEEKKFEDESKANVFDISFENGVIQIPKLKIDDKTERIIRNLIAYEQLNFTGIQKYVTEYMTFLDNLINSEKDVEILCRNGIFENWLGDDKAVATLFNKIGDEVFCGMDLYDDIQKRIHNHFMKKRKLWMANLRHNYFHTPWSSISVVAATILLLFTGAQTVFSILPHSK